MDYKKYNIKKKKNLINWTRSWLSTESNHFSQEVSFPETNNKI